MNSLIPASQEQQTALQIVQTSNRIATAEQLAVIIETEPRYYSLPMGARVAWLGQQIIALNYMAHSTKIPNEFDLVIESKLLDQSIMDDEGVRCLTQVEMQEAFRRGLTKEYGDFFGITAASIIGFLRGFKQCPKRMKAIAILYDKEQKRIAEERRNEDRLFYELQLHGFVNPWGKKEKKKVSVEESAAHRKLIEKQREEILRKHEE